MAFGTECGGGVGGSEHDVDLVEHRRHGVVELGSAAFGTRHRIDREAGVGIRISLGDRWPDCAPDLGGVERDADADAAGRTPHAHDLRESEVDLDALHPAERNEFFGRSDDEFFGLRPDDGAAEVGNDGDPQRTDLVGAATEPGLIALDPRQTSGVSRVEAIGDVEVAGGVAGAAADGALDRRGVTQDRPGSARNTAEGRLEADQAAEAGGDADRSAAIARRGEREEATGNTRGRTARAAAGGALEVPGVASRAVDLGGGLIGGAEFAGCRLHGGDRAGGLQPFDGNAIGVEHLVGEGKRSK